MITANNHSYSFLLSIVYRPLEKALPSSANWDLSLTFVYFPWPGAHTLDTSWSIRILLVVLLTIAD